MTRYVGSVTETREVRMIYTVEAESVSEAKTKMERGDTISEEFAKNAGVLNREVRCVEEEVEP